MRRIVAIRRGARRRRPAGEDVGFEQPLSERLCKLLFVAPMMWSHPTAGGMFGLYAARGIASRGMLVISALDVAIRRGKRCGTVATVVGIKVNSGKTIPATVFSADSAARRHVL
jgi:hypothetical protein